MVSTTDGRYVGSQRRFHLPRGSMSMLRHVRYASVVVAFLAVMVGFAPVASAAVKMYQYSFTAQGETDTFTDTGLCSGGPANITTTYNEALKVSATEANLTQDEIEALLDDDPTSIISKSTYT